MKKICFYLSNPEYLYKNGQFIDVQTQIRWKVFPFVKKVGFNKFAQPNQDLTKDFRFKATPFINTLGIGYITSRLYWMNE